jgi:hypothetical protein
MKKCTKCWDLTDNFTKDCKMKDWLYSICKVCCNNISKEYIKTKEWLSLKMYDWQKRSSKKRGYNLPNYTLKEFRYWLFSQENFNSIYNNWIDSWYEKDLIPSVDRLDDYISYTIENIRLTTWLENKSKWHTDRKSWINNKNSKSVISIDLITWEEKQYYSIMQASRETWTNRWNISSCCNGNNYYKTVWGFKWKYVD